MILFSALMLGTTGTFTSCKDYDDDIKNLQEQIDKKASIEELTAKVNELQTAINEAKATAEEAKATAQEALDKANAGSGEGSVTEQELADLEKKLQDQIDKLASLEEVDKKLAAMEEKLKGEFATEEQITEIAAEVDALSAEVMALIGHRLTSLSVIPTTHVNGILLLHDNIAIYSAKICCE